MFRSNVPAANLPDGWHPRQLKDIARIHGGGRLGLTKSDYVDQGIPAYSAAGQDGYVDVVEGEEPSIILSSIGARCGKSFLANGPWATLANTQVITPDPQVADACYLIGLLDNEDYWNRSGSAQPFIKPSDVKGAWVPIPPLDEQRRIAEVLRSVDEAIAAADAVIGKLRETRSHRLEALMALPGKFRRIDEICRLSGGYGFPIKHQGKASGRYPFAKVSDMNRPGNEVQMRHAENYVDEVDIRTLKAKTFPVGTTFFPKVGATLLTNKRRIAAVEMLVDNNVMGAVATHVDPWFLYYAFCTIDMADYVQPGAVPSVNQRTVGQIMVPVPDRAVQEEFVATMRDLESAIEAQSDALTQLMTAKLALMSDLLSGRVRVPA